MRDVDHYLAHAEHALDMLAKEADPAARLAFERSARAWLQLAQARMETLGLDESERAQAVSLKIVPISAAGTPRATGPARP